MREGGRPACAAQVGMQLDLGLSLALALVFALGAPNPKQPDLNSDPNSDLNPSLALTQHETNPTLTPI